MTYDSANSAVTTGRRGSSPSAADATAQKAIRGLLEGQTPAAVRVGSNRFGRWTDMLDELSRAHREGGTDGVRTAWAAAASADSTLGELIASNARGITHMGMDKVRDYYGDVEWGWQDWLPSDHVSLIVGEGGVGKSQLAASLIAAFTGRGEFPDGASCERTGKVVLIETESMRGPYAARLEALGVNLADVRMVVYEGDALYVPDLKADAELIAAVAQDTECVAIFVDSLAGGHDIKENSEEMKRVLQMLAQLAATSRVPVIAVHHLRKKTPDESDQVTLDRVRGSSVIGYLARSVLALWVPDAETGVVRVDAIKSNFGALAQPFGFVIGEQGLVFRDAPEQPHEAGKAERAADYLKKQLDTGPKPSSVLFDEAADQGISSSTLYRAADTVGVRKANGVWSLPLAGGKVGVRKG